VRSSKLGHTSCTCCPSFCAPPVYLNRTAPRSEGGEDEFLQHSRPAVVKAMHVQNTMSARVAQAQAFLLTSARALVVVGLRGNIVRTDMNPHWRGGGGDRSCDARTR
jgi:hypothetical protein